MQIADEPIDTARLRLRRARLDDFPQSAAMWAEAAVGRYIGGKPSTEEDSWARFLRQAGHWAYLGYGYWVITDRATGAYLGELGFADLKRDIDPAPLGPELGWVLPSRCHGRGFATEAARAALEWAEARFSGGPTSCIIHPENRASIRVAEKCGFKEIARTTYHGAPTIVYMRKSPHDGTYGV